MSDLRDVLAGMTKQELLELAKVTQVIEQRVVSGAPMTDDELHTWIKAELGINIPREAVCENHNSPFSFVADFFFERENSGIVVANRGGSKTFGVAILHYLNGKFKAGIEGFTFGATEAQSKRAYAHLKDLIRKKGDDEIESSLESMTRWKNGSSVEIVPGTIRAVNGPHPQVVHADEVELMDEDVFYESLPADTPVLTPSGWVAIGHLTLDDDVIGADGKPTKVTKIMDLGRKRVYSVNLSDGRCVRCCGDHLWTVQTAGYQRRFGVWRTHSTSYLADQNLRYGPSNTPRYFLPTVGLVEFADQETPVDPYLLGVVLGDGSVNGRVSLVSEDEEILDLCEARLPIGMSISRRPAELTNAVRGNVVGRVGRHNPVRTAFVDLGLHDVKAADKRVPCQYLYGSPETRLAVLRGLMDTDGSYSETSRVATFASISKGLVEDVAHLVRSLSGRAILSEKQFSTEWSQGTIFVATISLPNGVNPFLMSRKADKVRLRERTIMPSITSIVPAGVETVRCISVANEDGLFVTKDFIVTHNSRNMAQSKTVDGRFLRAQNIITSTRKRAAGLMQRLVDEVMDAELQGKEAPYRLYTWCIFETAQNVPNCQKANPDLPAGKRCPCDSIKRGKLEGGVDRTLADVCAGRLARSQGWIAFDDVIKLFLSNTPEMWEAQQECKKPSTSGMVVPSFTRERHCIKNFEVDPANGPIYEGIDFGGTNPHAVLFLQVLEHEIDVEMWGGGTRRLPQGAYIYFDEIYKAEISNNKLADLICDRESRWRQEAPGFRVHSRFCDPQGKAARLDLRNHNPALPSVWHTTRDVREHLKLVNELFSTEMIVIDATRCLMMVEEIEAWHYPRSRSSAVDDPEIPVSDFDHAMSAMRYSIANVARLGGRVSAALGPISSGRGHTTATFLRDVQKSISTGGYRNSSSTSRLPQSERWRATFGSDRLE